MGTLVRGRLYGDTEGGRSVQQKRPFSLSRCRLIELNSALERARRGELRTVLRFSARRCGEALRPAAPLPAPRLLRRARWLAQAPRATPIPPRAGRAERLWAPARAERRLAVPTLTPPATPAPRRCAGRTRDARRRRTHAGALALRAAGRVGVTARLPFACSSSPTGAWQLAGMRRPFYQAYLSLQV